jgi:hypothetical protein
MDASSAAVLSRVIEAHENWCRAEAVADRRQPAVDPDCSSLVGFEADLRTYATFERRESVD